MANKTDIVRAFGEAWARRDIDAVMEFFSDDCVYAASVGPEPGTTYRGRDAVRAGIERMFEHDAGSTVEVGRTFAEGDRVFSEWFYRFPPESNQMPAHGCDIFEFRGRKIRLKDAFRKQAAPPLLPWTATAVGTHELYRPRRFEGRDTWVLAGRHFKPILISHKLEQAPFAAAPETVAAARDFAATIVAEMDISRHSLSACLGRLWRVCGKSSRSRTSGTRG
jgi:ketosteroid isomerase-like protein